MNLKIKKLLVCLSFISLLQVIPGFSLQRQLLRSNFTEENYNQVETTFYKTDDSSSHIKSLPKFIKGKILPNLESRESFLDIGAGPGEITNQIAPHFKSSTIVEPNPLYKNKYSTQKYTLCTANFQDVELPQDGYDLVLCSHVLYHVDHNEWAMFLKKMHSYINRNGLGIIVLVAPRGDWHELRKSITPNYSNSALVEKNLNILNLKYKKTPNSNLFSSTDYHEFKQLVYLFTIDDCFLKQDFEKLTKDEKESVFAKIDTFIENCKTDDGRYEVVCEDDYLEFSA